MKYLFDASAWIAYLEGETIGDKVNKILKDDNEIYTLPITISEVVSKTKRKGLDAAYAFNLLISSSLIIGETVKTAKYAGLLHAETRQKIPNFGIVDAILISIAKEINAKILTSDSHFKSFKEAIIL